jgi:DNA-directed RNA polymerase specialized sigma24 family protein
MSKQQLRWEVDEWRERLRDRDPEAWGLVYSECLRVCRSLLRGWPSSEVDPEDAAHIVFKELLEQLDSWEEVRSFISLVQQRARWRCVDLMRGALRERGRREAPPQSDDGPGRSMIEQLPAAPSPTLAIDDLAELPVTSDPARAAVYQALHGCIAKLKPVDREILSLKLIGRENAEIAPMLSPPLQANNVAQRYFRVIHKYLPICLDRGGFSPDAIERIWGVKGAA